MQAYKIEADQCLLQVYVKGDQQSDVGILFLHGGPGSGAHSIMNLSVFQEFEDDYCCVYFDQRGSGLSLYDLSQGITKEQIVEDVLRVVIDMKKRFAFKKVFLWGGSFGGCLASLCIQSCRESFDGFILSSPAITFSRKQSLDFFNQTQLIYQKKLKINSGTQQFIPEEIFSNDDMRHFVFSEKNSSHSLRHICAMSEWFYSYFFETLSDCDDVPILIFQGKDDPICCYRYIDDFVAQWKNPYLEYFLFENCGHEVFSDQKKEFVMHFKKFIRRYTKC